MESWGKKLYDRVFSRVYFIGWVHDFASKISRAYVCYTCVCVHVGAVRAGGEAWGILRAHQKKNVCSRLSYRISRTLGVIRTCEYIILLASFSLKEIKKLLSHLLLGSQDLTAVNSHRPTFKKKFKLVVNTTDSKQSIILSFGQTKS